MSTSSQMRWSALKETIKVLADEIRSNPYKGADDAQS